MRMHDDDQPLAQEPDRPERYWTEAEWERFMLENQRLMDRYQKVWEENPGRDWKDPLDLYYKVHYDLDAPDEPESQAKEVESEAPSDEVAGGAPVELPDREADDFRDIPAYKLAFEFANAALDYMKRFEHEARGQNPLREQFCLHALRIAADITGGHGMGYEEDALCGNIVKNRWALGHAQEAQRLLKLLMERDGADVASTPLLRQFLPIINALEERIAELRAKVWWDQ